MNVALFSEVPAPLQSTIGNGCGPEWLHVRFPDGPFADCNICREHDFYYTAGGDKLRFLWVERLFRARLIAAAKRLKTHRWRWLYLAYAYSAFTRVWGYRTSWEHRAQPLTTQQTLDIMEHEHD